MFLSFDIMVFNFFEIYADNAAAPAGPVGPVGHGGQMGMLVVLCVIFIVMYFLQIRPAKKAEARYQEMLKAISVGDKVMMRCGMICKVSKFEDEENIVVAEIASGVFCRFDKNAISRVIKSVKPSGDVRDSSNASVDNVACCSGDASCDDQLQK